MVTEGFAVAAGDRDAIGTGRQLSHIGRSRPNICPA
jgi:hypothetical protein